MANFSDDRHKNRLVEIRLKCLPVLFSEICLQLGTYWKHILEVCIEAYKDHDNRLDICCRVYGQAFCVDLLGILDVLWPVVLLLLEGQAQWCPGWKFDQILAKSGGTLTLFHHEVSIC